MCYGNVAIDSMDRGASYNYGYFTNRNGLSIGLGDINEQLAFHNDGFVDNAGSAFHLVSTSAVPVPAAVWLFGSGLIGLIGVARRKKA